MVHKLHHKKTPGLFVLTVAAALAFVMCAGAVAAESSDSDRSCQTGGEFANSAGGHFYWNYDGDSMTLTIEGSGDMTDFESKGTPWYPFASEIEQVVLPDGLTGIGAYAFSDLIVLSSVTVPKDVATIGTHAFSNCCSLTSVFIPASVSVIKDEVFSGCIGLKEILVDPDNGSYRSDNGILFTKDGTGLVRYPADYGSAILSIPDTVTTVYVGAFADCRITSVRIPCSVTYIAPKAFCGCALLGSVEIPCSVTEIYPLTFMGCSALTSVSIPDTVTAIDFAAFYKCSSLESAEIPCSVTAIRDSAFRGCASLTSVAIPCSVTAIEQCAFQGCCSLPSITVPGSVAFIGDNAFADCCSLTAVYNYSGIKMETGLFGLACGTAIYEKCGDTLTWFFDENCGSLLFAGSGTMYDYWGNVPWYRFSADVESIVLPEGLTHIGSYAFASFYSLYFIEIPETVETIGHDAFTGCTSLICVKIPCSVTEIGDGAFSGCSSLKFVTISCSVTEIGDGAFEGCPVRCLFNDSYLMIRQGMYGLPDDVIIVIGEPPKPE